MTLARECIVGGGIAGEVPDHKACEIILAFLLKLRELGPSERMMAQGHIASWDASLIEIRAIYAAALGELIREIEEER